MFKLSGLVIRTSAAADRIYVDVLNGKCTVLFNSGNVYDYTNVSRRALFNLLNDDSQSLGFFINNHLLYAASKCAKYGTTTKWKTAFC